MGKWLPDIHLSNPFEGWNWNPFAGWSLDGFSHWWDHNVTGFFEGQYHWLSDGFNDVIQGFKDGLWNWTGLHAFYHFLENGVNDVVETVSDIWNGLKDVAGDVSAGLAHWFNQIGPWFADVFGAFLEGLMDFFLANIPYLVVLVAGLIVTMWAISKYGLGKRSHRLKVGPVEQEVGEVK